LTEKQTEIERYSHSNHGGTPLAMAIIHNNNHLLEVSPCLIFPNSTMVNLYDEGCKKWMSRIKKSSQMEIKEI
jgi:hypothetical protein